MSDDFNQKEVTKKLAKLLHLAVAESSPGSIRLGYFASTQLLQGDNFDQMQMKISPRTTLKQLLDRGLNIDGHSDQVEMFRVMHTIREKIVFPEGRKIQDRGIRVGFEPGPDGGQDTPHQLKYRSACIRIDISKPESREKLLEYVAELEAAEKAKADKKPDAKEGGRFTDTVKKRRAGSQTATLHT